MQKKLIIIGATGNVGNELVRQVVNNCYNSNDTMINGVASKSNGYLYSDTGISPKDCLDFSCKKKTGINYKSLDDLLNIANESASDKSKIIFIDVTPETDITNFHLNVLKAGYGLATANKNPLALSDFKIFKELTRDSKKYGCRATVMAGAESIYFLQDTKKLGDNLIKLQGCFSGTLGYICAELDKRKKFSDIIKEAIEKGFTEPNPRNDLNGLDVARKLVILARSSGYDINLNNVSVEPFIDEKYLPEKDFTIKDKANVTAFIKKASELNNYFLEKVESAAQNENVLRYIARMDASNGSRPQLIVSLQKVSKNSSLGRLNGPMNKIEIVTNFYNSSKPYTTEAPGAGAEVTAMNVRRDIQNMN